MNILVIRVSAIGDVIHTLPAIFFLKKMHPEIQINWIVQEKAAAILVGQPFIKAIHVLPNNFLSPKHWKTTIKIIQKLRKTKWDAIIDFQGIEKTTLLMLLLKGIKFGFNYSNARSSITSFITNYHDDPCYTNIIQKNLSLASFVSQKLFYDKSNPALSEIQKNFYLKIPKKKQTVVSEWINNHIKNPYIIVSPNTTWSSKHWPLSCWKELILTLILQTKLSIILVGSSFGGQAKQIALWSNQKNISLNISPSWDLLSIGYLIKKSHLIVAPDTGLLHLADFLGALSIGIFGPTNAKKHGPFLSDKNQKNVLQVCCPHLYKKTHSHCKNIEDNNNCMYKLKPNQVYKKILKTF